MYVFCLWRDFNHLLKIRFTFDGSYSGMLEGTFSKTFKVVQSPQKMFVKAKRIFRGDWVSRLSRSGGPIRSVTASLDWS